MHSIYIESGDEITTVIERLREAPDDQVALVAPKGATLLQSVVNLKLARKAATDAGKGIVIVTTDKIGKNLCNQLGIAVATSEDGAADALGGVALAEDPESEAKVISGVRIHRYYEEGERADDDAADGDAPEPIIIPKQILREKETETTNLSPVVVPEEEGEGVKGDAEIGTEITRTTIDRRPVIPPKPSDTTITRQRIAPKDVSVVEKRVFRLSLYVGAVGILAVAALSFLFLPFAHVVIAVQATDWSRDFTVTGSTAVTAASTDHLTVPAQRLDATVDGTYDIKPTGSKEMGDKATGAATLYNYDSTSSVSVPSGTTLTVGTKKYSTTAAATVPGFTQAGGGAPRVPGKSTVPVTAVDAGTDSNVSAAAAGDIHIGPVTLSSNTVTASGGTSKLVNVITAQDLAAAKDALIADLTSKAKAKLADQLKDQEVKMRDDSDVITPGSISYSVPADTQTDAATATGSVTISRTIIAMPTLVTAEEALLLKEQSSERRYAMQPATYTVGTLSSDGTTLTIAIHVQGKESAIVPVENIATKLAGKSLSVGTSLITTAVPTGTVQVQFTPRWWPVKRFPTINRYITVTITDD